MQGRLPGGGPVQLRPESREVSHKGMGKAVQGRGLDVQRPEGRENRACEGGAAEFGGPSASGGSNMRSKRWVEVRSEEEWFLAGRPAVRRLSFLRCHTPRQDDVLCLLGWAAKAAQNRLFIISNSCYSWGQLLGEEDVSSRGREQSGDMGWDSRRSCFSWP